MKRMWWMCLAALALSITGANSRVIADPIVTGTSVVGVDQNDAYIGTGGLILPSSFSGGTSKRRHIASCFGCTWAYTVYCDYGNDAMCAHAVVTCPPGKIHYRVWFGQTQDALAVVGSVCWGPTHPVTRRIAQREVLASDMDFVPALHAAAQPDGGTVTSIPAVLRTGQPTVATSRTWSLAGLPVRVTAVPRWFWEWGDGTTGWFAQPGGRYPNRTVTHSYRTAGSYQAKVTTVWRATYTVAGLGPFPVDGDLVRQEDTVVIDVRSAQTLLTDWT